MNEPFRALLDGVDALALPDDARAGLVDLLRAFGGARLRVCAAELDRRERVAHAVNLLNAGRDRAAVVAAVAARFGVSERTARRDVADALDARRPAVAQV